MNKKKTAEEKEEELLLAHNNECEDSECWYKYNECR